MVQVLLLDLQSVGGKLLLDVELLLIQLLKFDMLDGFELRNLRYLGVQFRFQF